MGRIAVTIEGAAVTRHSGKPKKVITGLRRKALHKALAALETLLRQDLHEKAKAERLRYTPALVFATTTDPNNRAAVRLRQHFRDMLDFKA